MMPRSRFTGKSAFTFPSASDPSVSTLSIRIFPSANGFYVSACLPVRQWSLPVCLPSRPPVVSPCLLTFPSASGRPVSLSMTLDMSQGKVVFSTRSPRVSNPKSLQTNKKRTLNSPQFPRFFSVWVRSFIKLAYILNFLVYRTYVHNIYWKTNIIILLFSVFISYIISFLLAGVKTILRTMSQCHENL